MKGTANSTALASMGIGADYVGTMDKLLVGLSIGGAYDAEKNIALEDNGYFNVGGISKSRDFPGIEDTDLNVKLTAFNLGVHFRYELLDGSGDEWFGWGGVKTHFGYEYNRNVLTLENKLDEILEIDTGVGILNGNLKGIPRYTIRSQVHSFPLEISSDVRFLKYLSLYGGIGMDLNTGKSTGTGDVKADVTPLVCGTSIERGPG